MDKTFEAEQTHLSTTYEKLQDIEHDLQGQLSGILSEVATDKDLITDELNFDFDADIHVETMAELEAVNRIIDTYNIAADVTTERLHRAPTAPQAALLRQGHAPIQARQRAQGRLHRQRRHDR